MSTTFPMPVANKHGPPLGRFFHYVWDTMDVPVVQEHENYAVITPTFDKLSIWGREVGSPYEEDQEGLKMLMEHGRVMGEWFSIACPQGEMGSVELSVCTEVSAEQFSQAYEKGWKVGLETG